MKRHRVLGTGLLTFAALTITATPARAVEISSTFSGGIFDGATTPGFFNYYVGYSFPSSPSERRNYFIFDLSAITMPVASAAIKLYLPGPPLLPAGYVSSDPTEDYRISGSSFPWTAFADAFGGVATPPALSAMFATMGTGPAYGLTTVSGDDAGTDIVIDLSAAAITDLNAALGGHFLVTGRLTDLHPSMPGMPPSELVFAYTDLPHPLMPFPRLELTFIPSPGVAALPAVVGITLLTRRRRASRVAGTGC